MFAFHRRSLTVSDRSLQVKEATGISPLLQLNLLLEEVLLELRRRWIKEYGTSKIDDEPLTATFLRSNATSHNIYIYSVHERLPDSDELLSFVCLSQVPNYLLWETH